MSRAASISAATRMLTESRARLRQSDTPRRPHQQLHTELDLKACQSAANDGFGEHKPMGGWCEATSIHDFDEDLRVLKVEHERSANCDTEVRQTTLLYHDAERDLMTSASFGDVGGEPARNQQQLGPGGFHLPR
jgi:hypothetical protein